MNVKAYHVPPKAEYVKTLMALTRVHVASDILVMGTIAQVMKTFSLNDGYCIKTFTVESCLLIHIGTFYFLQDNIR